MTIAQPVALLKRFTVVKKRVQRSDTQRRSLYAAPITSRATVRTPSRKSAKQPVPGDSRATSCLSNSLAGVDPNKPFVILADDDDVVAIIATQLLQQAGVYPKRCIDGNDAFDTACFSPRKPDLILMDLNMPDMSGAQSAQLIRDFYQARGVSSPVIIGFTSMTDLLSLQIMRTAGAVDFLPKSPTMEDIRRVVLPRLPGAVPAALPHCRELAKAV